MKVSGFIVFFLVMDVLTVSAWWGNILTIGSLRLDFFLPALAWYALNTDDSLEGCIIASLVGVFCDLVFGNWLGLCTLVVPGIFLFMKYIVFHAAMDMWWHRIFLVLVSSFVFQAILRTATGYIDTVWPWGAFQSMLDAAAVIAVFPMLASIMPFLGRGSNE